MIQPAPSTAIDMPVYLPQLSAARPRGGLRNLGELVECLIRTYEAQARVMESFSAKSSARASETGTPSTNRPTSSERTSSPANRAERQVTFDWYQNRRSGR